MDVHEREIDGGGVSLLARCRGDSGPTVILLHGVTANRAVWDPVAERLAARARVVAVDQRGHGLSGKPPGPYDAAAYSDDVRAIARAVADGPAIVVGHSLGARNAIVAAARFPELVAGFVAIDFTPYIEDEVFDALETRVGGGDRNFASRDEITRYLRGRYRRLPEDAIDRRAEFGYREAESGFVPHADPAAMSQTVRGLREDLSAPLTDVRVPGVLVRGAESALVSAEAFRRTCALRPDLDTAVVPDADHYVPEEQPAAVASIVEDVLARYAPVPTEAD